MNAIPDMRSLWCIVEGDPMPFMVIASIHNNIAQLKDHVYDKIKNGIPNDINPKDLELWKVGSFYRPAQMF